MGIVKQNLSSCSTLTSVNKYHAFKWKPVLSSRWKNWTIWNSVKFEFPAVWHKWHLFRCFVHNFRLAVKILLLQLSIYALKKQNNWRFPTPSQPRISCERPIFSFQGMMSTVLEYISKQLICLFMHVLIFNLF
jgi:hypothetical protein